MKLVTIWREKDARRIERMVRKVDRRPKDHRRTYLTRKR